MAIYHKLTNLRDPLGTCADDCPVCVRLPLHQRSTAAGRKLAREKAILPHLRRAIAARVREWAELQAIESILDREIEIGESIAGLAVGYDRARDVTLDMVREVIPDA